MRQHPVFWFGQDERLVNSLEIFMTQFEHEVGVPLSKWLESAWFIDEVYTHTWRKDGIEVCISLDYPRYYVFKMTQIEHLLKP